MERGGIRVDGNRDGRDMLRTGEDQTGGAGMESQIRESGGGSDGEEVVMEWGGGGGGSWLHSKPERRRPEAAAVAWTVNHWGSA